jgi:aconitate hydratase
VLESLVRNCDGKRVKPEDVRALARWKPKAERTEEVPFVVAAIVLQDFTGVPLLVDLAAMRSAVERLPRDPGVIEPLVPVALVVDHSVQVDQWGTPDALRTNMEIEFRRNRARYEFLKWGMQAFDGSRSCRRGSASCTRSTSSTWRRACRREGRRLVPGLARRDRLPHDDDQRARRRGLGRRAASRPEAGMLGQPVYS